VLSEHLRCFPSTGTEPEPILDHGNFWTVNPRQPHAEAVVDGGGWARRVSES
jgi:hypothetical protein